MEGYVYIIANQVGTVLYIGSTTDIERRMVEHKCRVGSKFASRYQCTYLLYFERFQTIADARDRERQLKNWKRDWKFNLIKEQNPECVDLAKDWFDDDILQNPFDPSEKGRWQRGY